MSNITRKKKKSKGRSKRLDLTDLTKALEDLGFARGFMSCVGVVQPAQDGGLHYDLDDEDLTVEVELVPSQTQLTVRVGAAAAGPGFGVWAVPAVGAEVLVAIPDGDLDFQPIIAQWYSSGSLPSNIDPTTLVIAGPPGGNVYIHDGSGAVDQVVMKSAYEAHVHPTGTGPSGVADNALAPTSYSQTVRVK